jgi:hypothetical protein
MALQSYWLNVLVQPLEISLDLSQARTIGTAQALIAYFE